MHPSDLLDEGFHLLNEFERGAHNLRALVAQHTFKEILMENLDNLIDKFHALKGERADLVTDRDAQKARADKAESDLKALQDQTAADEAKVKAALDDVSAEVEAEKPITPVVTTSTLPSGAPVTTTVDPNAGTTQAAVTDPGTGVVFTTTVQHADGSASTVDPSGTPVATSAEAVQAATQAAQAVGVTVPAA